MGLRDAGAASAHYEVLAPLGEGGYGAVYEARDTRTGQRVALKELRDSSGQGIARFKQEFRALTDVHHPNLVSLKELIEQDGKWLIAMELVEGTDLLAYVTGAANDNAFRFDEGRLRRALSGMAFGLSALHGHGILHRDLKPSNVRVTPEGRAVLLDFGLATSIDPKGQSTHAVGMGTVSYMAPEQALGQRLGPEADLYALGVCLFECLTGRLPIEGATAVEVLLKKQGEPAPRASSVGANVPADLDVLCARLLSIDPASRPSAAEVRALLAGNSVAPVRASMPDEPVTFPGEEVFAGRAVELQRLQRALADTHDGHLRIVLVEGESGVGKSELVAEFVRRSRAQAPNLLRLYGRCYENEQVPYKAFDGCIDELSRALRRLSREACAAMLPVRAAVLTQLFPVLKEVKPIAQAPRDGISADPTARRLEAFEALSRLLCRLAAEQSLVMVVDDLQWADAESFRLLKAMVDAAEAPPILLVATIRPRGELEPDVLAQVLDVRTWPHTSVIELLGLPEPEARVLARRLLGRGVPDEWLSAIVRESEGHPLFLAELVQFAGTRDIAPGTALTLEQALRARMEQLDPRARELLELVSVAARPHGSHVFARALFVTSVDEPARSLLALKLLRLRKGQELSCFHDRIRHTAVALIAAARLPGLHRRLAEALANTSEVDESEQARHWDLGGEPERAIDAYRSAAEKALATLAFARAEQLCGRALTLIGRREDERRLELTIQRARALACVGRNGEAARFYDEAADRAHGDARMQLRSRAAQNLVLSANYGAGLLAVREVLRSLGYRLPRTPLGRLLRGAWDALCIAVQAPFHRRPTTGRLNVPLLKVGSELQLVIATVHPVDYLILTLQAVRRWIKTDTLIGRSKVLTFQAWSRAMQEGSLADALPLLRQAREIAEQHGDPPERAAQLFTEGSAYTAAFEWAEARPRLEAAQRILQEECPDQAWLLLSVRHHLGGTWFNLGEFARLAESAERWMAEARERKDMLSLALISGLGCGAIRHLMADAPKKAMEEVSEIVATLPATPFSFPHLGRFLMMGFSLTYEGGPNALRWLDRHETEYGRAQLFNSGLVRAVRRLLRMAALLAAAKAAHGDERDRLLEDARKLANRLRRAHSALVRGWAESTLALILGITGARREALAHARTGRALLENVHDGRRFAANYVEGLLEGGREGQERCARALAVLHAEGWAKPERAICMVAPLVDELATMGPKSSAAGTLLRERYEVLDTLGGGGFGSVVRARDAHTGREVALKELSRKDGVALARFKREFRTLQEVQHENLVRIDSLFEHAGSWYISMELVEGERLLDYVRPFGLLDVARLRRALRGLLSGLSALHEAGFVHRDVSPQNVRVTEQGRAVLLDFGLVARIGDPEERTSVGTPAYAAPEQLDGCAPSPAADVYALGACLYEALSGRPPFEAQSTLLVVQKRGTAVQPLEGIPDASLAATCMRMLSPSDAARPSLESLREALLLTDPASCAKVTSAEIDDARDEVAFAGREAELSALSSAFESTCDAGFTVVLVEGESGVGKSALVAEFARRVAEHSPRVRVLRSRCYENEQVALKAFDGAVDELAHVLRGLPNPLSEALMPRRTALLAQLFPVLTSVPTIAHAPKKGLPADPAARALSARACFVELLRNLGTELELLFVVEDLQWADGESLRLLHTLIEQGDDLPFLFLCTTRPRHELEATPIAEELAALRAREETTVLSLAGLTEGDAAELADALHGAPLLSDTRARIVRESRGHPLFLRELVAQERRSERGGPRALTLDDALRDRIARLPPEAQKLLALAALAGKPLDSHVYARALGHGMLARPEVVALLDSGLLRRRGEQELACHHDRIRRVIVAQLPSDERRRCAEQLALALSSAEDAEPADLARLWDEARRTDEAIRAYERAGARAMEKLAFVRAEQHYARALALLGETGDEHWRRLLVQRGHALVRAGLSAEAARVFQEASRGAEGELAVRLRIWAAQHLMQSAHVDEGLEVATALLCELSEPPPRSEGAALLRTMWERMWIELADRTRRAEASPISTRERLALEALHALTQPMTAVAPITGMTLTLRYLRRALAAGESELTARALALRAMWRTVIKPQSDETPAFERSRALAEASGNPELRAHVEQCWGIACMQNQLRAAPAHFAIAHELLQSRCPGEPWALTQARTNLGAAWMYGGNYRAIALETGPWVEEARARDDRYAFASLTGFGASSLRHVIAGRPGEALAEIDRAMAPWADAAFSVLHFGAFCVSACTRIAAADPTLFDWLERENDALRRPIFMRAPTCQLALQLARLNGVLLMPEARERPRAPSVLAKARKEVRAIAGNKSQPAAGVAKLGHAVLLALEGQREPALSAAEEALAALRITGHHCERGAAYLVASLSGGDEGQRTCASILSTFAEDGFVDPRGGLGICLPGTILLT